jgi:hypothetical protein
VFQSAACDKTNTPDVPSKAAGRSSSPFATCTRGYRGPWRNLISSEKATKVQWAAVK